MGDLGDLGMGKGAGKEDDPILQLPLDIGLFGFLVFFDLRWR